MFPNIEDAAAVHTTSAREARPIPDRKGGSDTH